MQTRVLGQFVAVLMVAVVLLAIPAPVAAGQAFWGGAQPGVVADDVDDSADLAWAKLGPVDLAWELDELARADLDGGELDRDAGDEEDRATTMVIDTTEEEEHHHVAQNAEHGIAGALRARFDTDSAPYAAERSRLLKPPRA